MVDVSEAVNLYRNILGEISKVVVGKEKVKESILTALVAGGHVLIEGPPGTAKTTIASSFARVIDGTFKRVQLTPDMMPADITGFYFYATNGNSSFVPGPLFANIVLADELNRTTPRTQAALLEAMQEYQVTIERQTYPLERPFMVIATEVKAGGEGTYPLTDVQLDRFMLRVDSEYPTVEEEQQVLTNIDSIDRHEIQSAASIEDILNAQAMVQTVHVSQQVSEYIVSIVNRLRHDPDVAEGLSTRAGIALYKCARVLALFDGRDYVIPDDIKRLAFPALEHRIRIKPEAEMDEVTPQAVLDRTLENVTVPKI